MKKYLDFGRLGLLPFLGFIFFPFQLSIMRTTIIPPHALDAGAVVPQCLDVHYVSDSVMSYMLANGLDYSDPQVMRRRQHDGRTEYRRSLIYAKQTVVNRAFFTSPLVYRDFEESSENEFLRLSFRQLIEAGAIVPFLFAGSDFLGDVDKLKASPAAKNAVRSLPNLISEITCVRLDADDERNRVQVERLAQSFVGFSVSVGQLRRSPELLNALAVEVYKRPLEHSELADFGSAMQEISNFANAADELNRTVLYERFLIADGEHDRGRFQTPQQNPHMLAQKKVLDVRYNTSLPDMLGRFALTPRGLPTHAAVDAVLPTKQTQLGTGEDLLDALRSNLAHTVFANLQEAWYLPALAELSIADVVAVRALPEWSEFVAVQEAVLGNPLDCLNHLESYAQKLGSFQRAFSSWYYNTHENARREQRYGAVVGVSIKLLGAVLSAAHHENMGMIERLAVATPPIIIPNRHYGYVARLFVDFIDLDRRVVDRSLSFSLDLLKSAVEFTREDVRDLFEEFGLHPDPAANSGAPSEG